LSIRRQFSLRLPTNMPYGHRRRSPQTSRTSKGWICETYTWLPCARCTWAMPPERGSTWVRRCLVRFPNVRPAKPAAKRPDCPAKVDLYYMGSLRPVSKRHSAKAGSKTCLLRGTPDLLDRDARRPVFSAIASSCSSMAFRAGSSPSGPPRLARGTVCSRSARRPHGGDRECKPVPDRFVVLRANVLCRRLRF